MAETEAGPVLPAEGTARRAPGAGCPAPGAFTMRPKKYRAIVTRGSLK